MISKHMKRFLPTLVIREKNVKVVKCHFFLVMVKNKKFDNMPYLVSAYTIDVYYIQYIHRDRHTQRILERVYKKLALDIASEKWNEGPGMNERFTLLHSCFQSFGFCFAICMPSFSNSSKCSSWASGISITWSLSVIQILRSLELDALEMHSNLCFSKPSE